LVRALSYPRHFAEDGNERTRGDILKELVVVEKRTVRRNLPVFAAPERHNTNTNVTT